MRFRLLQGVRSPGWGTKIIPAIWVWESRSLRLSWTQETAGSNPAIQTLGTCGCLHLMVCVVSRTVKPRHIGVWASLVRSLVLDTRVSQVQILSSRLKEPQDIPGVCKGRGSKGLPVMLWQMHTWYSGCALDFQSRDASSILAVCSLYVENK